MMDVFVCVWQFVCVCVFREFIQNVLWVCRYWVFIHSYLLQCVWYPNDESKKILFNYLLAASFIATAQLAGLDLVSTSLFERQNEGWLFFVCRWVWNTLVQETCTGRPTLEKYKKWYQQIKILSLLHYLWHTLGSPHSSFISGLSRLMIIS